MKEKSGRWTTTQSLTTLTWSESIDLMMLANTVGSMYPEELWDHTTTSGSLETLSYTSSTTLQSNEEICQRVSSQGDFGEGHEI